MLAVTFGVFGLMGAGLYSLDAPLRVVSWTMTLFLVTVVLALTGMWAGTRPRGRRARRGATKAARGIA